MLTNRKRQRIAKEVKIWTPNKLLTRLPVLLAQIEGGNNSYKLKNKIRLTLYLLYQHNEITKKFIVIESSNYKDERQQTGNPKLLILIYLKMLALIQSMQIILS